MVALKQGGFAKAQKSFSNIKKMWNKAEVRKGGGGMSLPPGKYEGRIVDAGIKTTAKQGLPLVQFLLEVTTGDYEGQKVEWAFLITMENEANLMIQLSKLKSFLSLWFDEEYLTELGDQFFSSLEKVKAGTTEMWVSEPFEDAVKNLVGSELAFTVKESKGKESKDGKPAKKYVNMYADDLLVDSTGRAIDNSADDDDTEVEPNDDEELEEIDKDNN